MTTKETREWLVIIIAISVAIGGLIGYIAKIMGDMKEAQFRFEMAIVKHLADTDGDVRKNEALTREVLMRIEEALRNYGDRIKRLEDRPYRYPQQQ